MHFLSHRNFFTKIFLSTTSLLLLGAAPFQTPLPEIVNHTKSLIVERLDVKEDGYHLTIRISAPVDVYGLALAVIGENGICDSHTLGAFSGPWLSAQQTGTLPELQFPNVEEGGFGQRRGVCSENHDHTIEPTAPSLPVAPRIVIEALVFEDGTYDGDPARAMMMEAERIGRERQFQRIAAQVDEELNSPGGRDWIRDLLARVSALTVEPEPEMVRSLQSRFGATGTPEEQVKRDIAGGLGTE